jgi:hypothetical protein
VALRTEGAGFLSPAVFVSVVEPKAFKAPSSYYVILNFTAHPSKLDFLLQEEFGGLGVDLNYQVPRIVPCFRL